MEEMVRLLNRPPGGPPWAGPNGWPPDPVLAHVHLQWFAAEDEGRTEEPTEHKIRKAREEGKVAKSTELTSTLVLLFGILVVAVSARSFLATVVSMVRHFLTISTQTDIARDSTVTPVLLSYLLRLLWPVLLSTFVAAVLGNVLQVGFLFTLKPLTPDFQRVIPKFGQFFKRSMFSSQAAFNLAKSIVKVAIIALIAFLNVRAQMEDIVGLLHTPFMESFSLITATALRIIIESALLMLVLSIVDYMFQKRQHLESLKMSKQELKEERKQYEGDPLVRSRLRERMREILTRNMLQAVPKADVVITNPTHYAVALEYERFSMVSPRVVAKGADRVAVRIREIAGENGVEIVENRPLARELFDNVEIGDFIPERYWDVVAAILAQVEKVARSMSRAG